MPKAGERGWHAKLLVHEEVRRWHDNLVRRSSSSADVYLRQVGRVLEEARGLSPVDLLKMEQQELEDTVSDCIDYLLRKKGLQGSTVAHFEKCVKSFLQWNGREVQRDNSIPGRSEHPNSEDQIIPSQEDLALTLAACDPRTAAALAMMAFAGVRPQVLGTIDASNGLRLSDLPDLVLGDGVRFDQMPAKVVVSRQLSKNGKPFFTFLGPEGCGYVVAYLKWRQAHGETLSATSPLIRPIGGSPRFNRRNNISDSIRGAMRNVGLSQRVFIWRSYFSNRCMMAEPKGLLAAWRRFFMGHSGDIQTQYTLRKKLQADVEEQMRLAYAKALPFLETGRTLEEDPVPELVEMFLQVTGMDEADVKALGLASKPKEEQIRLLQEALQPKAKLQQRLVPLDQMEACMAEGWMFKATLPDNRVIMEMA